MIRTFLEWVIDLPPEKRIVGPLPFFTTAIGMRSVPQPLSFREFGTRK